VVVVGLGAAGALAAHVLTEAGAEVVGLEAGGWELGGAGPGRETPTVRRRRGAVAVADGSAAPSAAAVGGSKRLSAGQSYRLTDPALRMRSAAEARHGPGAFPPEVTVADWPLTPADLEPYHRRVERLFGVAGAPGGALPLPATPWTALMADAADRLAWSPFPAPVALVSPGSPGAAPPGVAGAGLLRPALRSGRLEVRTGARVLEVTVDADGAASGVRFLCGGREEHLAARAVVLAASALGNVRLLLLSRPPAHPAGLGNAGGQLGRHYATHAVVTVHGHFPGRDLGRAAGPPGQATATAAFDGDAAGGPALGFVGGSILQAAMGGAGPAATAALGLPATAAPSVGTVWAQPEQLPREAHVLDLDPTGRDDLGRPLLRVTHDLADDDRRRAAFLQDRMAEWLREAGASTTARSTIAPASLGTHRYGGTRMGHDPGSSVVDADLAVHGVPGLVVLGGSTFPSTGGRGPTQTIEALAWRAAERLAAQLRDGG
jgi:gluconate 2-dehydrogenase alpha chain